MNRRAPLGVEDRNLPVLRLVVGRNELVKRLLGALAGAKQFEPEWPI